jgi:hypothetical protein
MRRISPRLLEGVQYVHTEELTLPASNGFNITISAFSVFNKVELLAQRPNEEIEYLTRGKVTPTSIKASFGQLGGVSLHFRPSGEVRRIRVGKKCAAIRPSVVKAHFGTFVGTITFKGEGDYTEVVPGRASGDPGARLSRKLKLACKAFSKASHPTAVSEPQLGGRPLVCATSAPASSSPCSA